MSHTRTAALFAALATLAAAAFAACDSNVSVGNGPLDGADATAPSHVWSGYIQGEKFLSGSDRMTATFTSDTSGTVVFGAPPAGAPVVDPSAPYPAGCGGRDPSQFPGLQCAESFAFTMHDVIVEPDRLRFSIDIAEKWASWCAGQKLLTIQGWMNGVPLYSCAGVGPGIPVCELTADPDGGPDIQTCDHDAGLGPDLCVVAVPLPDGGPPMYLPKEAGSLPMPPLTPQVAVVCELEQICNAFCTCTFQGGCGQPRPMPSTTSFDLHVTGSQATGPLGSGSDTIVYLTEQ